VYKEIYNVSIMNPEQKNQSIVLAAVIIGAIIVLVAGYYFYGKSHGTQSFPVVPAPSPMATSTAVVVVASSTEQAPQGAAVDTSTWETYLNFEVGFSIKYPKNLLLDSSDSSIFKVTFPKATYFSTVYSDDVVVSVVTGVTCQPIIYSGHGEGAENIVINGINFLRNRTEDVAAGNLYNDVTYDTMRNGVCYRILFHDHRANGAGLYESDPAKIAALTTARDAEFAHVSTIVSAMLSSFIFVNTPNGQDETTYSGDTTGRTHITPVSAGASSVSSSPTTIISIDSIFPGTASIGSAVTVNGSGFLGHDTVVWITNGTTKGVLWGGMPASDNSISAVIQSKVCTIYNGASGLPCPSYLVLAPGTYAVYVVNQNGVTDTVYLKIQ